MNTRRMLMGLLLAALVVVSVPQTVVPTEQPRTEAEKSCLLAVHTIGEVRGIVRAAATMESRVLALIPHGETVEFAGRAGDWIEVRHPNVQGTGWMHKDILIIPDCVQ